MILYFQFPPSKRKKAHNGYIEWHDEMERVAYFFDEDDRLIGRIENPRVRFMTPRGMLISGYEATAKPQRPRVQEWFIAF